MKTFHKIGNTSPDNRQAPMVIGVRRCYLFAQQVTSVTSDSHRISTFSGLGVDKILTITITRLRTITLTSTITTIEFKWFKWFKEFKSLMKKLHVVKITIFPIRTKKMGVFLRN